MIGKYREVAGAAATGEEAPLAAPSAPAGEPATDEDHTKTDKEWRTKMAAQKRAKVMAQMAAAQKHFMKKNAKLFEDAALDAIKSDDRGSSMDLSECTEEAPIAVGPRQTARMAEEKTYTCILCQEDTAVTTSGRAMVLAAFIQQSTVLCQTRKDPDETNPLFLSSKLGASPHTSTCGHVMHASCWQKYFDNVLSKETRRPYRLRQPASFDVEKNEYLCPLCECLSNTVLPLLPALGTIRPTENDRADVDFETWLKAMRITLKCTTAKERPEDDDHPRTGHDEENCRYCQVSIPHNESILREFDFFLGKYRYFEEMYIFRYFDNVMQGPKKRNLQKMYKKIEIFCRYNSTA